MSKPFNEIGDDAKEQCRCGRGWCPIHGTDHLPLETEAVAEDLRHHNLSIVQRQKALGRMISVDG